MNPIILQPTIEVVAKVFSTPSLEVFARNSTDWTILAFNGAIVLLAAFLGAFLAFQYNRKKDKELFKLKTEYNAYLEVEKRLSSLLNKTNKLTFALDGIERGMNIAETTDKLIAPSEAEISRRKSVPENIRVAYQAFSDAFIDFHTCNEANQIFLLETTLLVETVANLHVKSFGIYDYIGRLQIPFLSSPKGIPDETNKRNIVEEAKKWNELIYDVLFLLLDFRTETQNYYFSSFLKKKIPQRSPLIPNSKVLKLIKPHWYLAHNRNHKTITSIRKMIYQCLNIVGGLMVLTSYGDKNVNNLHDLIYRFMSSFNSEKQILIGKIIQDINVAFSGSSDLNIKNKISEAQIAFKAVEDVIAKEKHIIDEISY